MLPVGKSMLEKRIYTRQELIKIYKTQRLDAIKNKVKREGYSYIDSGRGASYTMQIVEIPKGQEEFREMYKGFYKQVRKDGGKFYNAERIIREKYGGKPKKRPLLQKNGFYNEQYNAVQELLEKEFSTI